MGKRVMIPALVLAAAVIPACSSLVPMEISAARTTSDGSIIVHEWTRGGETRRVTLGGCYGMMVFYDAFAEKPAPRFELYLNESKQVLRTMSLERFKQELGGIPPGGTLHYYNTCAGGTHSTLNPAVIDGIKTHCANEGIFFQKGDDEVFVICTCL